MPINKAAHYRFEILDECLRNDKKKWSKADLLKFINRRIELHFGDDTNKISASQLRYDLESMQSEFAAPIEMYRDGRSYYYRYDDPQFSIRNIPVEDADVQKLAQAVQILQGIEGFSIADEVNDIVKRLEGRYRFPGSGGYPVIAFESSPQMQGIENLEDIYQAILQRTPLKISYQTFKSPEPRIWHIHPYLLKEHSRRWYLLGYCEEKGNTGILALDRMRDIRVARSTFTPNTFVNGNEYFRDVIGVTIFNDQETAQVEVIFSSEIAPYLQTKPLHRSQEILQQYEDGSLRIRLSVHINPELTSLLLSYGKQAVVLQPATLVQTIKDAATEMLRQYAQV